jgi:hypothetical protein
MSHPHWVVVEDATADYLEGSVVDATRAHQLSSRGVALLPFSPDLAKRSGVGGYMRRGWGAGYPLDAHIARMHCPLATYGTPGYEEVHWRARLVADEAHVAELRRHFEVPEGQDAPRWTPIDGLLRLAPDSSQATPLLARAERVDSPVNMRELGAPDARGGWTVGGELLVRFPQEGVYGFGVYGSAPGLRVAWAAMSLVEPSRRDR